MIKLQYIDLKDSNAANIGAWFARYSTNSGNNTNWMLNSGNAILVDSVSLKDSSANLTDTFYAANSQDSGNNRYWIFKLPLSQNSDFFSLFNLF